MKVAIIGAGGLVGSEFTRHLSACHDVLSLRHPDLDISDGEGVMRVIVKPSDFLHSLAAYLL